MSILANWRTQLNILWLGQAILMAMMTMSLPYWPLYIAQLGQFQAQEIRFWSAAIYIAPFVTAMLSSPLWGKLGDRYGYKPMVIRACLGLLLTQFLILIVNQVFFIFLIRLLQGALAGFIVAAQSWGLAISPNEERGATIGKLQSATAVGSLLGPLLGGMIATYFGYYSIFLSSTFICLMITLLFACVLQQANAKPKEKPILQTNVAISWWQKQIALILLVIVLVQLARFMVTPIFALFISERLGGNDMVIGWLYAATGFMVFLSAPSWGRFFDYLTKKGHSISPIVMSLLLASAVLQFGHAYANSILSILILRLLWGLCLGALLPVLLKILVDLGQDTAHGMFLGLGNSATKLGNLLGIIIGAFVEANFGFTQSFLINAFFYILAAIILLLQFKPKRSVQHGSFSHDYP